MATVKYKVTGSYLPFLVILRDLDTDLSVDSSVVQESGVEQEFLNVPVGDYVVEVFDTANGVNVSSSLPFTTTTTSTTTTTTTLPPTTSTTTTAAPTTTTTTAAPTTTTTTTTTAAPTTTTTTTTTTTAAPYRNIEFISSTPSAPALVDSNDSLEFQIKPEVESNLFPIAYRMFIDGFEDIDLGICNLSDSDGDILVGSANTLDNDPNSGSPFAEGTLTSLSDTNTINANFKFLDSGSQSRQITISLYVIREGDAAYSLQDFIQYTISPSTVDGCEEGEGG